MAMLVIFMPTKRLALFWARSFTKAIAQMASMAIIMASMITKRSFPGKRMAFTKGVAPKIKPKESTPLRTIMKLRMRLKYSD